MKLLVEWLFNLKVYVRDNSIRTSLFSVVFFFFVNFLFLILIQSFVEICPSNVRIDFWHTYNYCILCKHYLCTLKSTCIIVWTPYFFLNFFVLFHIIFISVRIQITSIFVNIKHDFNYDIWTISPFFFFYKYGY